VDLDTEQTILVSHIFDVLWFLQSPLNPIFRASYICCRNLDFVSARISSRPVYIYISDFGVGKNEISRQVFTPFKTEPSLKSS
jgi:hypothetical protein